MDHDEAFEWLAFISAMHRRLDRVDPRPSCAARRLRIDSGNPLVGVGVVEEGFGVVDEHVVDLASLTLAISS